MSRKKYIPKKLKELVVKRARNRCEYCQTQVEFTAMPMDVEHIIPVALQGLDEESNLCLSCPLCNGSKSDRIGWTNPATGERIPLFNPRRHLWRDHFEWSVNGELILAMTLIGHATIEILKLNRPDFIIARRKWVEVGWHPPID